MGAQDGDVYSVGTGYGQKFTDGQIFYTPDTGAHLIYGEILDKASPWADRATAIWDSPPSTRSPVWSGRTAGSAPRASDKPAIFWTSDTGAWVVRGALNAAWDKLGGSPGTLGVPTEDERYDGDVVSQKFTGGELSWNTATRPSAVIPPAWPTNWSDSRYLRTRRLRSTWPGGPAADWAAR